MAIQSLRSLQTELRNVEKRRSTLRNKINSAREKRNNKMLLDYLNGKSFAQVAKFGNMKVSTAIITVRSQWNTLRNAHNLSLPDANTLHASQMREHEHVEVFTKLLTNKK